MKIVVAENAGFCFGVKRAIDMALDAVEKVDSDIASLGPIIHSPQMVAMLEDKGIGVKGSVDDFKDEAAIIRSHGITRDEMLSMKAKGLQIVDTTCPFVKKAQEYAAQLSEEGYTLVIVGEKDHPEVQGIVSYVSKTKVWVVANKSEAEQIGKIARVAIIAQTTQSEETLAQVVDFCLKNCKEIRIFNTICNATNVRQEEARRIASDVELMLVVGGRNSANTARLAIICRDIQPKTYHVETVDDIDFTWFSGVQSVGITAGASTPGWLIEQVVTALRQVEK